ncbi:zinc finger CCCH domain-containing protein 14-like [Octopus sinensis]|uniref:Zinc finger CCCH domain-containing protein 14 n=1 Tax=Octopus sinensis TaxID=2607531 RepID=A0A6P7U5H3_9MOLL|nr:zinc finger CCCH domain-containing protein 14-like [Octopus sinensis]
MDEISTNVPQANTSDQSVLKRIVINRADFDSTCAENKDNRPVCVTFNNAIKSQPVDQFAESYIPVEQMETNDQKVTKIKERCKFWPSCANGDQCQFHHPNVLCRTFPNCTFGDKCIYIHPNCMFDANCSRPNCPYTHTTKNLKPPSRQNCFCFME